MSECISINLIKRKFLACCPISTFEFSSKIDWHAQREIFEATVGDPQVREFPIKEEYQQKFVRKIVETLENGKNEWDYEIYELFYETLCDLLSKTSGDERKTHYRHFLIDNPGGRIDRLIIEESRSLISEGTTGLCSWQAALALGEWCILHKDTLQQKKILELGSGVGLTGLTVLNLCSPKKFTFSDCHPSVLGLLRSNVDLNSSKINDSHEVLYLPWENIDEDVNNALNIDVVIAADVIYDNHLFPALINALKILLNSENCYGILAMTVRNEKTIADFFQQLTSEGFTYEVTATPQLSIFITTDETPVKIIKLVYSNKKQ